MGVEDTTFVIIQLIVLYGNLILAVGFLALPCTDAVRALRRVVMWCVLWAGFLLIAESSSALFAGVGRTAMLISLVGALHAYAQMGRASRKTGGYMLLLIGLGAMAVATVLGAVFGMRLEAIAGGYNTICLFYTLRRTGLVQMPAQVLAAQGITAAVVALGLVWLYAAAFYAAAHSTLLMIPALLLSVWGLALCGVWAKTRAREEALRAQTLYSFALAAARGMTRGETWARINAAAQVVLGAKILRVISPSCTSNNAQKSAVLLQEIKEYGKQAVRAHIPAQAERGALGLSVQAGCILPVWEEPQQASLAVLSERRCGVYEPRDLAFLDALGRMGGAVLVRAATPAQSAADYYELYMPAVSALAAAIDVKDHYTFCHSRNVAVYACRLARAGGLAPREVALVRQAALLHDIGKIGIPEAVLTKPGKLTPHERALIQKHVEYAAPIIRRLPGMEAVLPAVLAHHERWDGTGYPQGLRGEKIPVIARILALADTFDAITTQRVYQMARPVAYAVAEIRQQAGAQFDPDFARMFVSLAEEENFFIVQQ